MKRSLSLAVLAIAGLTTAAFAADDSLVVSRPAITVFHEFGSIVSGTEQEKLDFENYFLQRSGVWITFKAVRNERLTLNATVGGTYWNPTFNDNVNSESFLRYFAAGAPRASATYAFGEDATKPSVVVEAGILPYKYNEYTHNLGEYLFRSHAYPTQVFTGGLTWVDVNRPSVTGLRVSQPIGSWFSHDGILSFETDQLPYYDLNLTYMAHAKVGKALKLNAGIQFARVLPIQPSVTNPDYTDNRYYSFNDTTYIENPEFYSQRLKNDPRGDSLKYVRGQDISTRIKNLTNGGMSFADALDSVSRSEGITGSTYDHYNASSTKLAGSFSFDPKMLIGDAGGMLGPNDLILYGEAALLGVKNYPVIYENRLERTVAMLGFNVPTFRQLEVLAVEMEWFGSKLPNSSHYSQAVIGKNSRNIPQPLPQPSIYNGQLAEEGYDPEDWTGDDIRWSVFARRQLVRGFSLDAQVASDNARGFVYPAGRRYWELFRSPSDWYWMLKLTASI